MPNTKIAGDARHLAGTLVCSKKSRKKPAKERKGGSQGRRFQTRKQFKKINWGKNVLRPATNGPRKRSPKRITEQLRQRITKHHDLSPGQGREEKTHLTEKPVVKRKFNSTQRTPRRQRPVPGRVRKPASIPSGGRNQWAATAVTGGPTKRDRHEKID